MQSQSSRMKCPPRDQVPNYLSPSTCVFGANGECSTNHHSLKGLILISVTKCLLFSAKANQSHNSKLLKKIQCATSAKAIFLLSAYWYKKSLNKYIRILNPTIALDIATIRTLSLAVSLNFF